MSRWNDQLIDAMPSPAEIAVDQQDETAALDRAARALYGTLSAKRARLTHPSAPCPQDGCEGDQARLEDEES